MTDSGTQYVDNVAWFLEKSAGEVLYDAASQGYAATHLGVNTVAELPEKLDFDCVLYE